MVRVRLSTDFLDGEEIARQVNSVAELIQLRRGRAAADVQRFEVEALISNYAHLVTQGREVAARSAVVKRIAVEAAVWAEPFTERNVRVEHVL